MRWLETLSERKALVAIGIFFAALVATVFAPFLFGGKIFLPTDAATAYYPYFEFYSAALKSGESFLWNPYLFSGFPTYLSQSAGFLDPVNILLFSVFDSFAAYHLRLALDLFLTMLFSYLAARALGVSRLAGALVGPGFILAYNWGYLSNPVILNSIFLMPLLVWAAVRIGEGAHRWRFAAAAGVGIGWSMLAGYAQITVYASVLFSLYLVAEQVFLRRELAWRAWAKTLGVLAVAAVLGLLVALPQILPALDFSSLTVRATGLTYEATQAKVINPGDAAFFLFPDNLYFPYISGGRRPLFVGALLFLLALITAVSLTARAYRRQELQPTHKRMLIIAGLLLFCLLAALAYSPLYYLLQKLPILSYFRYPYRWMYVGVWFLACFGGFGFDYIRTMPPRGLKVFSVFLAACGAALATVVAALNFLGGQFWAAVGAGMHALLQQFAYGRFGLSKDPAHYQDAIVRGISAWQESLSLASPAFACALASLIVAISLLYLFVHGRLSASGFALSGFALSVLTFVSVFATQWPQTLPQAATTLHTPIAQALPGVVAGEYRTFPFLLTGSFSKRVPPQYTLSTDEQLAATELQFAAGWPNTNLFAGAQSADGYDQFVSTEMLAALAALGSTHGAQDLTRNLTPPQRIARLLGRLDLLSIMSVKYVISGEPLADAELRLLSETLVTRYQVPVYVYENKQALPRVRFAQETQAAAGESMTAMLAADRRFGGITYLDCTSCARHAPGKTDSLVVERTKNGLFEIKTNTKGGRWLVVSESALPGWTAHLDGAPVSIVTADGLYMAIEVPAGEHSVIVEYRGMRDEKRWMDFLGISDERAAL